MKKFFYSHPSLTQSILFIIGFLPMVAGVVVSLLLPSGAEGEATVAQLGALIGGVLVSGLFAGAFLVTPLKMLDHYTKELARLKCGRTYFEAAEKQSRRDTEQSIVARLEQKGMKSSPLHPREESFVGVWQKRKSCLFEDKDSIEAWKYHHFNYFLYSVSFLDEAEWARIRADLTRRFAEIRTAVRAQNEKTGIINAVCILADNVDASVIDAVRHPQSFQLSENLTLRGIRVCAAEIPQNRWYLPAERAEKGSRAKLSRRLLGKMTFGLSASVFPYQGTEYTEDYYKLLDEACNTTLTEAFAREKEKKRQEKDEVTEYDKPFLGMQEGEIRLVGDVVYCVDRGLRITAGAYLPEEAEKEAQELDEDEDMGDMEDWLTEDGEDENDTEEEHIPSFAPDYRGALVVAIPTIALEPRMKMLNRATRERLCEAIRAYLLGEGFESVTFWDTDSNTFETPEI